MVRVVLRVDVAIPAIESFYVLNAHDIFTVIGIGFQIGLRFYIAFLCVKLESFCKVSQALEIINQFKLSLLWAVHVYNNLLVPVIIGTCGVPKWVDHEDVLSWLQHRVLLVQQRKAETASKSSVDQLALFIHKD